MISSVWFRTSWTPRPSTLWLPRPLILSLIAHKNQWESAPQLVTSQIDAKISDMTLMPFFITTECLPACHLFQQRLWRRTTTSSSHNVPEHSSNWRWTPQFLLARAANARPVFHDLCLMLLQYVYWVNPAEPKSWHQSWWFWLCLLDAAGTPGVNMSKLWNIMDDHLIISRDSRATSP